jgi:serpin B
MKKIISVLLSFMLITLAACQQENISDNDNLDEINEKSQQLIRANNEFGLDIFREIRIESDEDNIMISPLSISLALAMVYNGANSNTKVQMEEALRLAGLTPEEINASYKMLIGALQSLDEDVVFDIANAIYYADFFQVKNDFLQINESNYKAEVAGLDFGSPSAVETINAWVAEKTHEKILKIIESLSDDARMVLLNAIYFNGIWSKKFDEDGTKERNFTKANGTNIEIPMMSKEDSLDYTSNDLFEAVRLPYGKGQYNMVVMLPAEGKNSQNIIDELNAVNWNNWSEAFDNEKHVVVTMPRFKFAFDTKLKDVLEKMGMVDAFYPSLSDFSGISGDSDLYISSVIHKSFIDVNENGTEAAAVTAIVFETTSVGPDEYEKIYFTVDKPFVFAITEKDTDAILFIGEVQNPIYDN